MTTKAEASEYGRYCWDMVTKASEEQNQQSIDYWMNEWRQVNEGLKNGVYEDE